MPNIRPAKSSDREQIIALLKELDLDYTKQQLDNFWVMTDQAKVIGVAKLEQFKDFSFLSSFGIAKNRQKHGLAKLFLDYLVKQSQNDIYLYTIIPDFFKKFDFQTTRPPDFIPSKERYECDQCAA